MRIRGLVLITLIIVLVASLWAIGKTYGEWDTSIAVSTAGGGLSFTRSSSMLKGMYFTGDVADMSIAQLSNLSITDRGLSKTGMGGQAFFNLPLFSPGSLSLSTYLKQDIDIDWPIGTYTVLSNLVFSVDPPSLTSSFLECTVSAYGLKGTGSFLLVPMGATYAFGTRLTLLGTTLAGMTVEASTYFGAWSLGKAFNEINKVQSSSDCFCYRGTNISLTGLMFGCVSYDTAVRFSNQGFAYAQFQYAIAPPDDWDIPVSFAVTLEFSPQTKSYVVLVPTLYFFNSAYQDAICTFYVALDVTGNGTGGSLGFNGMSLTGVRLSGLLVGQVNVSGILSLGDMLYTQERDSPIYLHASDYSIYNQSSIASKQSPTPYDMVISLDHSTGNFGSAVDVYWGCNTGSLFGLKLFTGEATYILSSELEFGLGLAVDPLVGPTEMRMDFTWSLYR
ncbi:MAG TPA: hypothetical protein ENH11_04065 [Candidatus Acetothermia bacterium]|nr:hypothetical protein [Candidatus Acetothermia bacterium]